MPYFRIRKLPDCEQCGNNQWLDYEIGHDGTFQCEICGNIEDFSEAEE